MRKVSRRSFLKAAALSAGSLIASGVFRQFGHIAGSTSLAQTPELTPQAYLPLILNHPPPPSLSRVAIAQANSYDRTLVRQQVQALLDGLGGLNDVIGLGDRVAIKTNLTGGTGNTPLPGVSPIESYVTHPEVVRALGELLRDAGAGQLRGPLPIDVAVPASQT